MQILVQEVGEAVSAFLPSFQLMLELLAHGAHSEEPGSRQKKSQQKKKEHTGTATKLADTLR